MSESDQWSQAWLETQRQYWDTLFNWTREATEAARNATEKPDFAAGLEPWWKAVSSGLPGEAKDTYKQVFDAGRNYFEMGEMFWNIAREAQSAGENWRQGLEKTLEEFKLGLQQTTGEASDAWSGFASGWGLGGDAWQDFMKSMGQSPVHSEALTGLNAGEAWNRMMSMPALGYTREMQEEQQEWLRLQTEYAKVAQEYASLLHATNGKAVDLLGRRIVELAQKGESPDTLRGMYDLWVDCGEEAYAELATDDGYLKVQGNLTNSMMRLKKHERVMMEGVLAAMNIPNRRELDTALCRLQETRRELRDLRDTIEDDELSSLRSELAELRAELRALKGDPAQETSPARAARSTASARKKTVAKKAVTKKATAKKKASTKRT